MTLINPDQLHLFDPGPALPTPPAPESSPPAPAQNARSTDRGTITQRGDAWWGTDGQEVERHPTTGLPVRGQADISGLTGGHIGGPGQAQGTPNEVRFAFTSRSARNKGDLVEIPIQPNPNTGVPAVASGQGYVSTARVNQMLTEPDTRMHGRIPQELGRDVPVVWQAHAPTANIIDGNHRITSAVLEGQLFQQVRRINLHNMGDVVRQTAKVRRAQGQARVRHGSV